nr:RNA-directed DNA polymerase, eukaryota, reverse transcriptase zinc-binding domain protein [Tanacetum cinerariifolium]
MENVSGIHSKTDTPNEKLRSNVSNTFFYVNVAAMNCNGNNKLEIVPLHFEDGNEVVVFDEDFVNEGSMKWKLTICGYFVGCDMGISGLRSRNLGISAIASRVGKPMIMDQVTADMCHNKVGRIRFAKVLVEIDATKGYTDNVEILYMDAEKKVKRRKYVDVEYAWKPLGKEWNRDKRSNDNNVKNIYRPKEKGITVEGESVNKEHGDSSSKNETNVPDGSNKKSSPKQNIWRIEKRDMENLKRSANKFVVLQDNDTKTALEKGENDSDGDEDEIEVNDKATSNLVADEIKGQDKHVLNVQYGFQDCSLEHKRQSILCEVEFVNNKEKILSSFVYAANTCAERRELQRDLSIHKRIASNKPWIIMGDFNATLKPEEHSARSFVMTSDMQEFHDVVNELEMDYICSSSFFYTWTKSQRNPDNSILKKLDRMTINKAFMKEFGRAHGVFLPYMVSDHSPDVLSIPDKLPKIKKSFKISNFVADKEEFRDIAQKNLNENPFNAEYRVEATKMYDEYKNASEDEMKLLQEQAKIKWLSDGDKNTSYFHSTLKARRHKSMIKTICDKNEIKAAIFDINSNKAHGPDRFSACFFKNAWDIIGGRGLRQGDPMSPYLFTLVMEIFNLIMINKIEEAQSFKYHFGWKEIKLTHLCFADDLLVVCNGDKDSLEVVKSDLKEFGIMSGLFSNLGKSTIFFGSINEKKGVSY